MLSTHIVLIFESNDLSPAERLEHQYQPIILYSGGFEAIEPTLISVYLLAGYYHASLPPGAAYPTAPSFPKGLSEILMKAQKAL